MQGWGIQMPVLSRRTMLTCSAMAAGGALIPQMACAADPVIPEATIAARKSAPVIAKKVNRLFNTRPAIMEPNDMQFAPNGDLWLLDQVDPNKVFTVNAKTGAVLASVETESIHGSGITYGDGAWFITSTKVKTGNPSTLKVDPNTGKTLKKWETPGWGIYGAYTTRVSKPGDLPLASGGHGVKWTGEGQYGEYIWCVGSDEAEIYKLRMSDGAIMGKIVLDKANDPSAHGLDIKDGLLWYCDANKGWICSLT
jgi:hypothetical protein